MVSDKSIADNIAYTTNTGYWHVGGVYFFNKQECLKYASRIRDFNITFHYNDAVHQSLDWSKEPSRSLKELYRERAQQLRDQYDYIILKFSGGADSRNILYTFLENDIKLDEVMTNYQKKACELMRPEFSRSMTAPDYHIFEYELAAKPVLDKLSKTHPHIKIQLVDSVETSIDFTNQSKLRDFALGGIATTVEFAGTYVTSQIARTRGERVCVIYGVDKPRISCNILKRQVAFYFNDFNMILGNNKETFDMFNGNVEYFYYTNQLPVLHQKQCFAIKNALLHLLEHDVSFYKSLIQEKHGETDIINVHHPFLKSVLYDNFDPSVWQTTKQSSQFYLENGAWFFNRSFVDKRTKDFYDAQVREFVQGVDPRLVMYKDGKPSSFKNFNTCPILF